MCKFIFSVFVERVEWSAKKKCLDFNIYIFLFGSSSPKSNKLARALPAELHLRYWRRMVLVVKRQSQ